MHYADSVSDVSDNNKFRLEIGRQAKRAKTKYRSGIAVFSFSDSAVRR